MSGNPTNVLLIHGIWNARFWLAPLAARLRTHGLSARVWGYSSVLRGADNAVPQLIETLRAGPPTHLLGHSLGGLVALEALRRAPDLPVPRIVCLGTPLRGSATARWLASHGPTRFALGRSSPLLCGDGFQAWEGRAEVGMIAGSVAHGVGSLLRVFGDASDGTVRVDETRVPGLADHRVVRTSHSGLVLSAEAARQAAAFLKNGQFAPTSG